MMKMTPRKSFHLYFIKYRFKYASSFIRGLKIVIFAVVKVTKVSKSTGMTG